MTRPSLASQLYVHDHTNPPTIPQTKLLIHNSRTLPHPPTARLVIPDSQRKASNLCTQTSTDDEQVRGRVLVASSFPQQWRTINLHNGSALNSTAFTVNILVHMPAYRRKCTFHRSTRGQLGYEPLSKRPAAPAGRFLSLQSTIHEDRSVHPARKTRLLHPAHHACVPTHAHTHAHIHRCPSSSHTSHQRSPVCRFLALRYLPRNCPDAQEAPSVGTRPTRIAGATVTPSNDKLWGESNALGVMARFGIPQLLPTTARHQHLRCSFTDPWDLELEHSATQA